MMQPMAREQDERIQMRIDRATLRAWQAAADAENRTLSNWIKTVCNAALAASTKKGNR